MTRLVTTGWETGDINEIGGVSGTGTQAVVTSVPTPRSPGTYCFKVGTDVVSRQSARSITLASAKTDLWVRFGFFVHAPSGTMDMFTLSDSAAGVQIQITWAAADQFLRVYRGGSVTLLGTSTLQLAPDQWYTLEIRWQASSATVGIVEVWVDDTRWLNLTGIDNTNTANVNVQTVILGNVNSGLVTTNNYMAYDDLAINDTAGSINTGQIHDGRVVLLKPNGAGSNTALTRGGTDTGANYTQVSELPPSMTQFVYSATVAARDTYALQDVPAGSWTVNACELLVLAQNSDAGAGSLGLTVKSGAMTDEATAQSLTTGPAYYRRLLETDPATSVAWTVANVSALEAGVTVR